MSSFGLRSTKSEQFLHSSQLLHLICVIARFAGHGMSQCCMCSNDRHMSPMSHKPSYAKHLCLFIAVFLLGGCSQVKHNTELTYNMHMHPLYFKWETKSSVHYSKTCWALDQCSMMPLQAPLQRTDAASPRGGHPRSPPTQPLPHPCSCGPASTPRMSLASAVASFPCPTDGTCEIHRGSHVVKGLLHSECACVHTELCLQGQLCPA